MRFIFPLTLICLLTLSLCTLSPKPADMAQQRTADAKPVQSDTIRRDTAKIWMNRWDVASDSIDALLNRSRKKTGKNPLDKMVVKGFFIPMGELSQIVAQHANDSIWAMLVVKPVTGAKNKGKFETGLIFMAYSKDGAKMVSGSGQSTYYDFTMPCPDACPPDNN
jgi:hypothetical protein